LEMTELEKAALEVEAHKVLLEFARRLKLTKVERAALKTRLEYWEERHYEETLKSLLE